MIPDRELDARLGSAAPVRDSDLPALPEEFFALLVADDGPVRRDASRRMPSRRTTVRLGAALLAVAAAWTTVVLVTPADPSATPQQGAAPGTGTPTGRMELVAAEQATFPLSLDPAPAGLTPVYSWFGGVPYYGDAPDVFTADYSSEGGDRLLLELFPEDPHGLPGIGWWQGAEVTQATVAGVPAEVGQGDSVAYALWERPDGRWVGILGEGAYGRTPAVAAVAETVVDRPTPLGLQFGLAPAGWSLGGYEESRSLDLVSDTAPGQPPLRLSLMEGFEGPLDGVLDGTPVLPQTTVTIQGQEGRMQLAEGGPDDPDFWQVAGRFRGGPAFLLLAPGSLTREQVMQMADQATYTP